MKRILTVLVSLLPLTAVAQVDYAMLVRNARQMDVSADIDLDQDLARGAKALALMPRIVGAQDTLNLKPVGVYLKDKHFQLLSGLGVASGDAVYGKQDLPATLHYKTSVPYQRWMDDSKLELVTLYEGCCGDGGIERVDSLAVYQRPPIRYAPEYINVAAPAQSKSRSVSGEASVVVASGSAKINARLKDNAAELSKIQASVDEVRANPDVTIQSVWLQGSASPEGKYASNEKLARTRTDAIKNYVAGKLDLPVEVYQTEFIAENWEGLRAFVAASSLSDKDAILTIIDSGAAPDVKEQQIRGKHAASWKKLSIDCLPELRRTHYRVDYDIRTYVEAGDVMRVMETAPENLTLAEFYSAAARYQPGTPEYTRIYRAALEQYPDEPVANLNAANAEMAAGNYAAAAADLAKAGNSAEAEYARGVLEASQGRYPAAVPHFRKALDGGVHKVAAILEEIDR